MLNLAIRKIRKKLRWIFQAKLRKNVAKTWKVLN